MSKVICKITNGITNIGKRTHFWANVYNFSHDFKKFKIFFFMIILQHNTIAMQLQKNKGRFIIADVNSFFF